MKPVPDRWCILRRRVVFCGTLALMVATIAWELGRLPAGGPTNSASTTLYWIPLAPGSEIAQTFTVPWNDFRHVHIHVKVEGQPFGIVRVVIDRMASQPGAVPDRNIRSVQASVRRLKSDEDVVFTFSPIPDSEGQGYRLRVSAPDLRDGALALAANRDDTYPFGSLSVDGREQQGDLVFAARGPVSSLAGLLRLAMRGRPWPFSSPVAFWVLLAVFSVTVSGLVVLAAEMAGALSR